MTTHDVPDHELMQGFKIDFADAFAVVFPPGTEVTPEEITGGLFTNLPSWVKHLTTLRDLLVRPLGLKTGRDFQNDAGSSRVGIIKVQGKTSDAVLVGEDDRHLNFRVLCRVVAHAGGEREAIVATYVHFNNRLGRMYVFMIKPFHRLIVSGMLGRTARALAGERGGYNGV